jgi:hypothetical protein
MNTITTIAALLMLATPACAQTQAEPGHGAGLGPSRHLFLPGLRLTPAPPKTILVQPGVVLPATPELAKKTASILALRRIHALKLTREEIQAVLPHLRALRDGEAALQAMAKQALEDERRALLQARPGDALPAGNVERLSAASAAYQAKESETWRKLDDLLNVSRSRNLLALLQRDEWGGFYGTLSLDQQRNNLALLKAFNEVGVNPEARMLAYERAFRHQTAAGPSITGTLRRPVMDRTSSEAEILSLPELIELLDEKAAALAALPEVGAGKVVGAVRVVGATAIPTEQLLGALKTRAGAEFDPARWKDDLAAVSRLYQELGNQARLVSNEESPEFKADGQLILRVDEVMVGSVKLAWDRKHKTPDTAVLKKLSQTAGRLYNVKQLQQDFRALNDLKVFDKINPMAEVAGDGTVTITWELREK